MLADINWDLAWTIACGIVLGAGILSVLHVFGRMLQDNWRVAVFVATGFIVWTGSIVGAFLGYFGWIWLVPGFISGVICYFVATNILVKEEEGQEI